MNIYKGCTLYRNTHVKLAIGYLFPQENISSLQAINLIWSPLPPLPTLPMQIRQNHVRKEKNIHQTSCSDIYILIIYYFHSSSSFKTLFSPGAKIYIYIILLHINSTKSRFSCFMKLPKFILDVCIFEFKYVNFSHFNIVLSCISIVVWNWFWA